ncbi:MAG: hypothetical protein H0W31_00020 [Actinobacteria bacterium]|nr:hypothetical protein [Actinomycetota bacterium]
MTTKIQVEPPTNLADFGRWLNEWGNSEEHTFTRKEREAYEKAISDAYDHFDRLYPNWPHET